MVFITVVESVYCAVQTDSLYKADCVSSLNLNLILPFITPGNTFRNKSKIFCYFMLLYYTWGRPDCLSNANNILSRGNCVPDF
jgi:hypothetical protein